MSDKKDALHANHVAGQSVDKKGINMEIKFQTLNVDARPLKKANHNDSGWDLTASSEPVFEIKTIAGKDYIVNVIYDTGVRVEFPDGYCGFVYPRSSIKKYDLFLSNSVGVIDEGYRGSIQVAFRTIVPVEPKDANSLSLYKKGDRIAQLVITRREDIQMVEGIVDTNTVRSTGGFGSSGIT